MADTCAPRALIGLADIVRLFPSHNPGTVRRWNTHEGTRAGEVALPAHDYRAATFSLWYLDRILAWADATGRPYDLGVARELADRRVRNPSAAAEDGTPGPVDPAVVALAVKQALVDRADVMATPLLRAMEGYAAVGADLRATLTGIERAAEHVG